MLQLNEFSPTELLPSRRKGRGRPYADLVADAEDFAAKLESRASSCQSASERRRLRVLWAVVCRVADCLSQTGCPLA